MLGTLDISPHTPVVAPGKYNIRHQVIKCQTIRNCHRFPNFSSRPSTRVPLKTSVRQPDQENRFVRTLGREPEKKEVVNVEIFDEFFIENEESPKSRTKEQKPKKVIIEGLGEIGGKDEMFNFSKNYDDFMFKFSFGAQNLFNKTFRANDYESIYPLTTTTANTVTAARAETTTEEETTTTTSLIETSTTSTTLPPYINEEVKNISPFVPETIQDYNENEILENNNEATIPEVDEESDPILSDASKSNNPSSLAQQLEDYLLVLPLKFRFLRKDSPLLKN